MAILTSFGLRKPCRHELVLAGRLPAKAYSQTSIQPYSGLCLSLTFDPLCLQHGIPSTEVRKTLERRLRDLNTPPRGVENIHEPVAQPGLQNNNETAAQRQDFTDDQIRTIQQLIKDTVQQSSREIANEAAKAAVPAVQASSSAGFLAPQPASLVPGTENVTSTAAVNFAPPLSRRCISRGYNVVSFLTYQSYYLKTWRCTTRRITSSYP